MSRLGFYFDANSCIGCKSCESGCAEWNGLPLGTRWRQVVSEVRGTFPKVARVNFSMACNNCSDAPCVRSCPTDALHVDGDLGLVQLTKSKCTGRTREGSREGTRRASRPIQRTAFQAGEDEGAAPGRVAAGRKLRRHSRMAS